MSAPNRSKNLSRHDYPPLDAKLFGSAAEFDFFQAVRLLIGRTADRAPVGEEGLPATEAVRFRVHNSLCFPPSSIVKLEPPGGDLAMPVLTVNFLGLTGPSGVLPRHYTELLERLAREMDNPERFVLRDWFDQFNHRFISLFYRSWSKYRFWLGYDRQDHLRREPDIFTHLLFSLVGLGTDGHRHRLQVKSATASNDATADHVLAQVNDFALLHYAGLLARKPRSADGLEGLLEDYFSLPIRVMQLQGQWLQLTPENQSCLGEEGHNNELGATTTAGTRVWDVESKIGLRVGPLAYAQYLHLLPDRSSVSVRKTFFLLTQMARFYAGPQIQLEIQLVLQRDETPDCRLPISTADGPQLGWNTWVFSQSLARDPDESVFRGDENIY